ncbi:MAG: hypothetical protein JNM90_06035 [Burkholderiales bacterium]|nr:hypothetical protein [Burkholderiales bacterium]
MKADVDPRAAARMVAARLMLPWFLLPAFGVAVALALTGHLWWGLGVFGTAIAVRALIFATSPGYVLHMSLADPAFFDAAQQAGALRITPDIVRAGS